MGIGIVIPDRGDEVPRQFPIKMQREVSITLVVFPMEAQSAFA